MKKMKVFAAALTILLILIITAGCAAKKQSDELDTRSMAQIHEEEGVPVAVKQVKKEKFQVSLRYNATVSGITESSASSSVSDAVEKVFFRVGDYVEKNTVVVKFPSDNAAANFFQAKAAYENSLETFKRIEQLYESKGVSRQDYDNAKTGLDVAKANWDMVNNMINVKSPISGYITRLEVRESENVESGDPLFTVANYDMLKARVWVSEKDISRVRTGQNAEAEWEGTIISGRVVQTDLSLNPERQAFGAMLEFDNSSRRLKSGVNAEIRIFTHEKSAAVVIDSRYLIEKDGEKFVFVASGDSAVKRAVKTGEREGLFIEITQGLNTGDMLITEGSRLVSDSGRIRIVSGE